FAQSVGGGGGNGGGAGSISAFAGLSLGGSGGAGGNGSLTTISLSPFQVDPGSGPILLPALSMTTGDRAKGILAQSIGGGGGSGGLAVQASLGYVAAASFAIGGNGGAGGSGGNVVL